MNRGRQAGVEDEGGEQRQAVGAKAGLAQKAEHSVPREEEGGQSNQGKWEHCRFPLGLGCRRMTEYTDCQQSTVRAQAGQAYQGRNPVHTI